MIVSRSHRCSTFRSASMTIADPQLPLDSSLHILAQYTISLCSVPSSLSPLTYPHTQPPILSFPLSLFLTLSLSLSLSSFPKSHSHTCFSFQHSPRNTLNSHRLSSAPSTVSVARRSSRPQSFFCPLSVPLVRRLVLLVLAPLLYRLWGIFSLFERTRMERRHVSWWKAKCVPGASSFPCVYVCMCALSLSLSLSLSFYLSVMT